MDNVAFMRELHAHPLLDGAEIELGDRQIALVQRFLDYYAQRKLIVHDEAPPLRRCCANGAFCWRRCADPDNDGYPISLPWIGPEYEPGGVLILGINFNDSGGLAETFAQAHWEMSAIASGRKLMTYDSPGYRGNAFVYGSLRAAALLVDVLEGREVGASDRAPAEMVALLRRVVRMQTVKCSPPTDRSKPWPEMWERCPPMLLADEIDLIRPRFIAAFGEPVRTALEQLSGFRVTTVNAERLYCGALKVGDAEANVFMLDHPRYGPWAAGLASLAKHLRTR